MPGAFDEHDPAEIPECVVEDSYIKISKGKLIKKILFNHYSPYHKKKSWLTNLLEVKTCRDSRPNCITDEV